MDQNKALMLLRQLPQYMMQKGYNNGMIDYRYMFAEFVNLAEENYW